MHTTHDLRQYDFVYIIIRIESVKTTSIWNEGNEVLRRK